MAKIDIEKSKKVTGIVSAPDRFTAVTGMQKASRGSVPPIVEATKKTKTIIAAAPKKQQTDNSIGSKLKKITKPSPIKMQNIKEVLVSANRIKKAAAPSTDSVTIDGQRAAIKDVETAKGKVKFAGNVLKGSLAIKNPKQKVDAITSEFRGEERTGDSSGSPLSAIKNELKKMGKLKETKK